MSLVSSPSLFYREMNLKWFPANLVRACIKTFEKEQSPCVLGFSETSLSFQRKRISSWIFMNFLLKLVTCPSSKPCCEPERLVGDTDSVWYSHENVSPTRSRSRCSTDTMRIVNSEVHTIDILLQPGLLQCTAFNAVHWVYYSPSFTWKSGISVRHTILFNVRIFQDYFKVQSQKNWTAR